MAKGNRSFRAPLPGPVHPTGGGPAVAGRARASTEPGAAEAPGTIDTGKPADPATGAPADPATRADVDPVIDTVAREREAGVDAENPFGRPGRPLSKRSPFFVGLTGALGVAVAYLVVMAIAGARQVLVLLLISIFLALGLDPAVSWLHRHGLSRRLSILVVFLGVIAFFAGFFAAVVPPVAHQITTFVQQLPGYLDQLEHNPRIADLDHRFHVLDRLRQYVTTDNLVRALGGFLGFGRVVLSATLSVLTVLILTLYLLGSLPTIKDLGYRLVPRTRRARVQLLGEEILAKVGGYVAGALTIAAIAGSGAFVFLLIGRAPYPLALAMIVAITDVIPLIGATIGAVIVTVVCLFVSIPLGIASAVYFVAYQQLENYLIYPRVMGRTVDVSPAATIVAALVGGTLLGVLGALLAIPLAAALSLLIKEVVIPRQDSV